MNEPESYFDPRLWKDRLRVIIVALAVILATAIVLWAILPGIAPNWTGFGLVDGNSGGNQVRRTLWDWLELMLIPAALLLGAWWVSHPKNRDLSGRESFDDGLVESLEIIESQHQEKRIQLYFDTMTELLLKHDLRQSSADAEVRRVARAQTTTILWALNSDRKGAIVRFLYESQLIQHPNPVVSLADANLSTANLSGANLSNADLRHAHLTEANLADAQLSKTDLAEADLAGAVLSGPVQENGPTGRSRWIPPNLRRANLSRANLREANLADTDLSEASLNEAIMDKANLKESILKGASLRGVQLKEADLERANLRDTDLREADLSGAKLDNALLTGASLSLADLTGVEARQVNLKGADLSSCNLSQARLSMAFLFGSKLQGANLRGANLRGANLSKADLTGALLEGVDLRGAYLSSAVITEAQLNAALSIEGAIMPDNRRATSTIGNGERSNGSHQVDEPVEDKVADNVPTSPPN